MTKRSVQLAALALLSIVSEGTFANSLGPRQLDWSESSWASIEPSKELAWVKCYNGALECTRLQVPLNYSDPENQSAAIAIVRLKANATDSPNCLGPILFNPGGPGSSGVDLVRFAGTSLAQVVGPQFDIVGFDPRGVARSTPRVSWYESRVERELWSRPTVKELNHSSDSVGNYWASTKLIGQLAEERAGDVLPHIQTDYTARDMLRITEAYGREKVQYWGFSYGTVLGSTFAALFPDKIERMVLDGVANVHEYYTGVWEGDLIDADNTLQWFYKDCHSAGPDLCLFYEPSPGAIEERLNKLYTSIVRAPVAVRTDSSYALVDYELLRQTIFRSLYYTFDTWALLAAGLADLEAGNGTALYEILENMPIQCSCDPLEHTFDPVPEAGIAIGCNDGATVTESFEEAERHYAEVAELSSWGSIWASTTLSCSSWPKIPKTFFTGPISGNTSHPILLIGNTADPVTPLRSARAVSQVFPGSVVLQQDSAGHCSISGPSLCTVRAIRDYFVNGTLPEPNTVCPVIGTPFTNPTSLVMGSGMPGTTSMAKRQALEASMTPEDLGLLQALRQLERPSMKSGHMGLSPFRI